MEDFAVVFPRLAREEIPAADHHSVPEWDSLASITLLAMLQQEFSLDIDLTDLDGLASYADVRAWLEARVPIDGQADA